MSTHRDDDDRAGSRRRRRRRRPLAWTTAVSLTVATAVAGVVGVVAGHSGAADLPGTAAQARTAQAGSGLAVVGEGGEEGLGATEQVAVVSDDDGVRRVTGEDRVATAVAVSRDRFPAGMPTAVLASADDFADALAGSALADAAAGPLLLTGRGGLDQRVFAELRDHLADGGTVYVLGGTKALASSVDDAVTAAGGEPVRLAGKDRYATAAVVASQVASDAPGGACDPLLVTGTDFPDGAAASGVVSARRPLLYTAGSSMPFATRAALAACAGGSSTATAVGGPAAAAVADAVLPDGLAVETVVGADRFDTSAQLMALVVGSATAAAAVSTAETTGDAEDPGQLDAQAAQAAEATLASSAASGPVVIASGADYADALVGGTYHRPVLLTEATALPGSVATALAAASSDVHGVLVVGGERAVSADAAGDAAQIASGAEPAEVLAAARKRTGAGSTSASPSGSASTSASASPSGSASTGPSASPPASSSPSGAAPGTALPAGRWLSGASGTGVADGRFATWRGSALGIVGTWSDNNAAMVEAWAMQPGQEYGAWQGSIDIAVGAIGGGETWQQAATGAYDARWRQSLTKMRTLWGSKPGTVYIRFAHEMNGNWYDWSVNQGNKDAFVASWKRYRALQQEIFPRSKLVFSVNRESVSSGFSWTQSFPGRQYVDVMGVDYYNQYPYAASVGDFTGALNATDGYGAPKGLQAHLDFARSQGLPLSVNEWSGISESGDSPGFIQGMHEFFARNAGSGPGQLLYEVQFNCDMGGGKFLLYQGRMPQSADMYRKLF